VRKVPKSRQSQKKQRSRAYNPADWTTGRAKARFPFSLFRNIKLFGIMGVLIMVGSVATGMLLSGRGSSSSLSQDFVTPEATAQATAAATPEGTPAAEPTAAARRYDSPPGMRIDTSKSYFAVIHTEKGDIRLELFPEDAPQTVNNFVFLARQGFYDGLSFHRVAPGFVAQGGDPAGDGTGGPGYDLPDEKSGLHFDAGTVGMARGLGQSSQNGSQFFITYVEDSRLDADFTAFGRVVEGMEVLNALTPRDPDAEEEPPPGDVILGIDIVKEE
jgi:cyclophilin family peptidyl-prolyl cis-trans isomerase